MASEYELEITPRVKFLNFFRRAFKFSPLEQWLVNKTKESLPESVWVRLIPPNYLYDKNSERKVKRNSINFSLDISDLMEHGVYFGYKETAIEKLFDLAKNKKVIIDVGVNIGFTLLNFAKLSPDGIIIGFEPDSKNFRKAQQNVILNDFGNITIVKKGLGTENIKAKLYRVNEKNAGMNRVLDNSAKMVEGFEFDEIEVVKLDDFINEKKLAQIDLIKIDVEGYELKVLKGAEKSLQIHAPTLFIELDDNNLKAQNDSAQMLVLFLEQLGYKIYNATDESMVKSDDNFSHCHFDIICKKQQDELSG